MNERVEVQLGDITKMHTDAIVNAANNALAGGGGVDGAIHRAAGPRLLEECLKLRGCPTGEAKMTLGYNLSATYVIHTVGPVWYGGHKHEADLLAGCYRNSLLLAKEHSLRSVAFPSISTGAYRYPLQQAAHIAVTTIMAYVQNNSLPEKIILVCFDEKTLAAYKKELEAFSEN